MRNIQSHESGERSSRGFATPINGDRLSARLYWIMAGTALATFGFLVAAYKLLFSGTAQGPYPRITHSCTCERALLLSAT